MISVNELRSGRTFQEDGQPYLVLKYEHTKMGRGSANIKVKVKNLRTGSVTEKTFISGAKVEEVLTQKKKLQYLYSDRSGYHFIEPKTFEQITIPEKLLRNQARFLKEEAEVNILFVEGEPVSVELAPKMKFKIKETGPGVKGDSATNIFKPATLENKMKVKVPLFIKTGEEIWVDTRTGEYIERVK
jgi:elongation factor P